MFDTALTWARKLLIPAAAGLWLIGVGLAAALLSWWLAVVLVIMGIVSIVRGGVLAGIVLVIVGLLVGPGGVSLF